MKKHGPGLLLYSIRRDWNYVLDLLGMGNDFGSSFGVEQFRLQLSDSCKRHQRFIGVLHMVYMIHISIWTTTTMVFLLFTVGSVSLSSQIRAISVNIFRCLSHRGERKKKSKYSISVFYFWIFFLIFGVVVVLSAFDVFTHQVRCVAAEAKRIRKVNDHKQQMIRFIIDLLDGMKECWGALYTVCKVRRLCTPWRTYGTEKI